MGQGGDGEEGGVGEEGGFVGDILGLGDGGYIIYRRLLSQGWGVGS